MSSAAVTTAKAGAASRARALARGASRVGQPVSGQLGPRLQLLSGRALNAQASRVQRIPFLVSCITLLCLGLMALLGINIALSHGAYEVHQLQREQQQLTESTQNLDEKLANASSPAVVSSRARALGMVPSGAPVFIQLSDGKILGEPKEAVAKGGAPFADLSQATAANPKEAAREAATMARAHATYRANERAAQGTTGSLLTQTPAPNSSTPSSPAPTNPAPSAPAQPGVDDGAIVGN